MKRSVNCGGPGFQSLDRNQVGIRYSTEIKTVIFAIDENGSRRATGRKFIKCGFNRADQIIAHRIGDTVNNDDFTGSTVVEKFRIDEN